MPTPWQEDGRQVWGKSGPRCLKSVDFTAEVLWTPGKLGATAEFIVFHQANQESHGNSQVNDVLR